MRRGRSLSDFILPRIKKPATRAGKVVYGTKVTFVQECVRRGLHRSHREFRTTRFVGRHLGLRCLVEKTMWRRMLERNWDFVRSGGEDLDRRCQARRAAL